MSGHLSRWVYTIHSSEFCSRREGFPSYGCDRGDRIPNRAGAFNPVIGDRFKVEECLHRGLSFWDIIRASLWNV